MSNTTWTLPAWAFLDSASMKPLANDSQSCHGSAMMSCPANWFSTLWMRPLHRSFTKASANLLSIHTTRTTSALPSLRRTDRPNAATNSSVGDLTSSIHCKHTGLSCKSSELLFNMPTAFTFVLASSPSYGYILTCLRSAQQLGDSNVHFLRNQRCQVYIYLAAASMIHCEQHPQHVHGQRFLGTTDGKKQICMSPLKLLLHCSKWLVQHSQYLGIVIQYNDFSAFWTLHFILHAFTTGNNISALAAHSFSSLRKNL